MAAMPWNEIAGHALDALNDSRRGLSTARDWMLSDWPDGQGPAVPAKKSEAQRLVAEAKAAVDRAKNALRESTGQ